MIRSKTEIRVRYAESDQMGYVHHSQYALYLEEARMDLMENIGLHPAELEREGVIMPVVEMNTRFSSPLHYGDVITVETQISPPWEPRLVFSYRISKQGGIRVSRASTTLVFADKQSGSLLSDPSPYLEYFENAFQVIRL